MISASRHMAAAAHILHLPNQCAVMRAHLVGQPLQVAHLAVIPGAQALRPVLRNDTYGVGHDHGRAPFGTVDVVMEVARVQALMGAKAWRNGGVCDAVFHRLTRQNQRSEEFGIRVLCHCFDELSKMLCRSLMSMVWGLCRFCNRCLSPQSQSTEISVRGIPAWCWGLGRRLNF